ncbi:hypothetical protein AURDEDRAFT_112016 [Auricularia subglabra TFB-10046 SS5]|nr:hypothetical protein AURDEDRAFT_112016 [Auricularia subglabra TFB-10046 SS5]
MAQSPDYSRRSKGSYYDRPSFDQLAQGHERSQSFGYNSNSFATPARQAPLKPGRDEEELINNQTTPLPGAGGADDGWDVYADFNNAGPRFSTAMGTPPTFSSVDSKGYRPLPNRTDPKSETGEPDVELVTVPAFGAEWNKDELRGMTKSARREAKSERRRDVWKAWYRGEHGFFGGCLTRKTLVFIIFGLIVVTVILLAICIPRVPSFAFNSEAPFKPTAPGKDEPSGPERYKNSFSRTPAGFAFNSWMDLRVNTHQSILPLHFNLLKADVYGANEHKLVATGNMTGFNLKAKSSIAMLFPLHWEYSAVNTSDLTWLEFYNACNNHVNHPDGVRPGFDVRVIIEMKIRGLVTQAGTSTQISGVACPIELPLDSA